MNKYKRYMMLIVIGLGLTAARPAHAQGGCDDSPENPTLVLAGLASAGYAASAIRTHLKTRQKKYKTFLT